MAEIIPVNALRPGMVINQVTAQNGPVKIRKSGLVSSNEMIQGLAEMGVLEVEIDPAQTVEIEQSEIPRSTTQKLLDRETPSASGFDHQLSEQFNRSLFLPSVQELPSSFGVYLRQGVTLLTVVLGGFGIGWTAANADRWLDAFQPGSGQTVAAATENSPAQQSLQTSTSVPTEEQNTPQQQPEVQQPIELDVAMSAQPAPQGTVEVDEPEPLVLGYNPEEVELDDLEPEPQPTEGLSPELLKRFEEAVAELDSEPDADYTPEPTNAPNVPMVHELPAWVLTELPSMAFSAHMYASNVNERWIRVNGRRVEEGQDIEAGLTLLSIEPQHVVLTYKGQTFSMAALTDW